MKTWQHITLPCPPQKQDLLIGHLEILGLTGFVQSDSSIEFYVASRDWTPSFIRSVRDAAKKILKNSPRLKITEVRDQNWNATWERSMKVVRATDRIIIRPSWKTIKGTTRGKIVITIDPKMSFGTGHHETTRLCLKLLEDHLQKESRVLDFGTGSGILAIAAVKLGAKKVDAVDNDPWCIDNARENLNLNKVRGDRWKVVKGSVRSIPGKRYGLIVANIDYPTIKRTIKQLLLRTKRDGILILSGLLLTDLVSLLEILLNLEVEPLMLESEGEWIGIALRKV